MECVAALHTNTIFQEHTHACRKVSSALVRPPSVERHTKFSCRSRREAIFGAADLGYSCWASVALIWLTSY